MKQFSALLDPCTVTTAPGTRTFVFFAWIFILAKFSPKDGKILMKLLSMTGSPPPNIGKSEDYEESFALLDVSPCDFK